jgi:pilus assembly protein CpaC
MVEIAVEITEIDDNKANDLGIKWSDTVQTGEAAWSVTGRTPSSLPEIPSIISVGDWARYTSLTAALKLLTEKGAAHILSKPKLVARSGTSAQFIVGGEFPVTAVGPTTSTVVWKEFGIKTEVTPKILADGLIDITLLTEVSRLDWSNQVQGYPVITKRQASSSVRLKDEQTIALAGLIETKKDEKLSGIPLLSEIPVIGRLFGQRSTFETKTNVLIFVTPRILK